MDNLELLINIANVNILFGFILIAAITVKMIIKKQVPYEQYVKGILPAEEYEEWKKKYSEMDKHA